MVFDEPVCPHCLARAAPSSRRGPDGLVTCRDCRGLFVPLADGGSAVPLPDHVVVCANRRRFAVVLRSFFVTFGAAPSNLVLEMERDRFSWSEPSDIGPLRFKDARRSVARADIYRLAWRRFGRRGPDGEHEVVTDLVLVDHERVEQRAGFSFPGGFVAGPSIATLLQWAHEVWFEEGPAYRTAGVDKERPPLSVVRKGGALEPLYVKRTLPSDPEGRPP